MTSSPVSLSPHVHPNNLQRKVLRKGTHSCWECKRRKAKCVINPLASTGACNACRRRGVPCISQKIPEESLLPALTDNGVRILRSLDDNLSHTTPMRRDITLSNGNRTNGDATDLSHSKRPELHQTSPVGLHVSTSRDKLESLSRLLHDSLPSPEDHARICKADPRPTVLAHEILTMPYTSLAQDDWEKPEQLLTPPGPHEHPVLLAKHMLLLAGFLQHLDPSIHEGVKDLSEMPRAMSARLAELAISLVTTDDAMLGSIEGLECVIVESVYHANDGNLRRSWLTSRRAVSIAQLMGLSRPNHRANYSVLESGTKHYPRNILFRIVFLDRFLSLLLGLPQACNDYSIGLDATPENTFLERIEQKHCAVASCILERNKSESGLCDYTVTQRLDSELQRAARTLPSKWWSPLKMDKDQLTSQFLFWDLRRIFAHVVHYNLLIQLHLPYMLQFSIPEWKHDYSRTVCINASREILVRFAALRSLNRMDSSCRIIDFLAFMAAITLLLAHLDSYNLTAENPLAHQYQSDRSMIEGVHEYIAAADRPSSDTISTHSIELLHQLLALDMELKDGESSAIRTVSLLGLGSESTVQDFEVAVSIDIPYFGVVKVVRQGMSMDNHQSQFATMTAGLTTQARSMDEPNTKNGQMIPPPGLSAFDIHSKESTTGNLCGLDRTLESVIAAGTDSVAPNSLSQPPKDGLDSFLQDPEYSSTVAENGIWDFTEADSAFLDSIMNGTGKELG